MSYVASLCFLETVVWSKYCISGKSCLFKAVVSGEPVPNVTWSRNNGDTNDPEKYKARYDERNAEYVFEVKQQ